MEEEGPSYRHRSSIATRPRVQGTSSTIHPQRRGTVTCHAKKERKGLDKRTRKEVERHTRTISPPFSFPPFSSYRALSIIRQKIPPLSPRTDGKKKKSFLLLFFQPFFLPSFSYSQSRHIHSTQAGGSLVRQKSGTRRRRRVRERERDFPPGKEKKEVESWKWALKLLFMRHLRFLIPFPLPFSPLPPPPRLVIHSGREEM